MRAHVLRWAVLLCLAWSAHAGHTQEPAGDRFRADAHALEGLIDENYAYRERLPGEQYRFTERLREEASRVLDEKSLLQFAERALYLLTDHHAITGSSLRGSRAVVPSYSDLRMSMREGGFIIDSVREGSPAYRTGIAPGDTLAAIDGVPIAEAVDRFWADLGVPAQDRRPEFAAQVLAAGHRDRARHLTVERDGLVATLEVPSVYGEDGSDSLLAVEQADDATIIRFHDSLGDAATIAAFDAAMAEVPTGREIVLDLRDTPSGGNTTVARAILGWFAGEPRFYQQHSLPAEERRTGIARQWTEQVLPRPGKRHDGPASVRVGPWTGSMGEGLAIGFDALGICVWGSRMAGLRGAIYDYRLPNTGLVIKLPTERLAHVDGTPREAFLPDDARAECGGG